jgi:hypothetical protein
VEVIAVNDQIAVQPQIANPLVSVHHQPTEEHRQMMMIDNSLPLNCSSGTRPLSYCRARLAAR